MSVEGYTMTTVEAMNTSPDESPDQ